MIYMININTEIFLRSVKDLNKLTQVSDLGFMQSERSVAWP